MMTIPAKYTLTEAHFKIVELERELQLTREALKQILELDEDNFKSAYHYQEAVRFLARDR